MSFADLPPRPAPRRPGPRSYALLSVTAAAAFGLAVAAGLAAHGFPASPRSVLAFLLLALPPTLVAVGLAVLWAMLRPAARGPERFLVMALGIPLLALPFGAAVFVAQHIASYPMPIPFSMSEAGAEVFAWTAAVAVYLFLSELRLVLPWGLGALLAVAVFWSAFGRR